MKKEELPKVPAVKFAYEIILSKGIGTLTKKAETMIYNLGNNAIRKKIYVDENMRLDCLQTGFLNMYKKWQNFNPDKTINAFAFFTEIFKRSTTEGKQYIEGHKTSKKGSTPITFISLDSINDGNGMYNI